MTRAKSKPPREVDEVANRIRSKLEEIRHQTDRYDQEIGDIQRRLIELIDVLIMIVPAPAKRRAGR